MPQSVSPVFFLDPAMPLRSFGHGLMLEQSPDHPAMSKAAACDQNDNNDQYDFPVFIAIPPYNIGSRIYVLRHYIAQYKMSSLFSKESSYKFLQDTVKDTRTDRRHILFIFLHTSPEPADEDLKESRFRRDLCILDLCITRRI